MTPPNNFTIHTKKHIRYNIPLPQKNKSTSPFKQKHHPFPPERNTLETFIFGYPPKETLGTAKQGESSPTNTPDPPTHCPPLWVEPEVVALQPPGREVDGPGCLWWEDLSHQDSGWKKSFLLPNKNEIKKPNTWSYMWSSMSVPLTSLTSQKPHRSFCFCASSSPQCRGLDLLCTFWPKGWPARNVCLKEG